MFHTNLESTVWKRHVGVCVKGHQDGRRKSIKTSGTHFCYKKRSVHLHEHVTTQPSQGRKQKNDDVSSSSPLGIIAGVTVSVALVLLVITALFIYRRRKSRKEAQKSISGQTNKNKATRNQKTNSAFQGQLEEQQDGLITLNNHQEPFASIYAPNYDAPQQQVRHGTLRHQMTTSSEANSQSGGLYAALNVPEGHNIYGPRNVQEDMSQNYGPSSTDQPVYNVLDDPLGRDSEETVNNGSNEPEPVYNVLEEPYAEGSEGPAWYGAVPVEGPVNNTLEEPDSPSTNEPVYNVLEALDHGGAGEADNYDSTGVQDPVYNVLEGPDPDQSSGDGLYSNSLEDQDPGNCNNIPVYAVVNKKKK
ncbi:hypothetical protein ACROYT_G032956 [Oculina patagonica]